MGIRAQSFIKCISIITALTTSSAACFSTPSATKEVNNEVLAIQLEQEANAAVINSNLLVEGGQTILIDENFLEKIIPITVSCENVNLSEKMTLTAKVETFSSDESRMTAVLDKQEVVFDGTEQKINLVISRSDYIASEEDNEEDPVNGEEIVGEMPENPTTEGDSAVEEEQVTENAIPIEEQPTEDLTEEIPVEEDTSTEKITDKTVYQLPSVEEIEKEKEPEKELGIWELPVIVTGTSIEVDTMGDKETTEEPQSEEQTEPTLPEESENITGEDVNVEEQPAGGETEIPGTEEPPIEGEITPDDQEQIEEVIPDEQEKPKEEQPEDKKETDKEDENTAEDEEEVEEAPLNVWVILTLGGKTFSAVFVVNENDTDENAIGELQYCPNQYHPTGQVCLINNKEMETIVGDFPAMTKYTVGEDSYLLYDGGKVRIPAGGKLELDLSGTQLEKELEFYSFAGTAYSVKHVEKPDKLDNTPMIIVDGTEKTLPVSYRWGEIIPVITIEHLTVSKEGLKWNTVESIICKEDSSGKIQMIPKSPEAGTYRIKVLWNENEISLYHLNIPFYVQCASGDQGGTGQ